MKGLATEKLELGRVFTRNKAEKFAVRVGGELWGKVKDSNL
jgi:hypothetical protein